MVHVALLQGGGGVAMQHRLVLCRSSIDGFHGLPKHADSSIPRSKPNGGTASVRNGSSRSAQPKTLPHLDTNLSTLDHPQMYEGSSGTPKHQDYSNELWLSCPGVIDEHRSNGDAEGSGGPANGFGHPTAVPGSIL